MKLADRAVRQRATTDFTTNLIVLAGAGTGKTSLLVERVLAAVGSGAARMREIAAITFTEKAAGEMRERMAVGLDRLRALARGERDRDEAHESDRAFRWLAVERRLSPEAIASRALEAMEELERGTVSTIHAFCADVLREFPLEAGIDPSFSVDGGQQALSLLRGAWEDYASRELGPEASRPELWSRLLARVRLQDVAALAGELALAGVPASLLAEPRLAVEALEELADLARRRVAVVDSVLARESGLSPVPRQYLSSARRALHALAEAGLDGFRAAVASDSWLAGRIERGDCPPPNKKLTGVRPEEFERVARQARALLRRLVSVDDELCALAVEAVAPFLDESRERLLRHGVVGFDGLLQLTRDLLRDHPTVRAQLKRRFRMLLVDEFQDTDPVQYEIVLFLGEVVDDASVSAYETRLAPGRLFVVGDAKQSIYRFRGADYAAYRRAVGHVVDTGGETLLLETNFRSVVGVIEPINRLFGTEGGCWTASDYQPRYDPIGAFRSSPDSQARVEVWTVRSPPATRGVHERREAEGRVLADAIERLVRRERRCGYRDITILLRAFTDIGYYLRPLRERSVPFVVDGGRDFLKRPEVAQLLAAFRALSQPADPTALLALLRSPAGAVSDVELARYAQDGGGWNWKLARVDEARFAGIARCVSMLRELDLETRHLPADAVVRLLVERTLLLPLGAAAFEGAQRVANLRKLAAAAGELARDGRLSLGDVVDALAEGRLEDIQMDRPLADDRAEAVRITSIHRMKGLENDWIFVPDLSRTRQARSPEELGVLASLPGGRPALAVRAGGSLGTARVVHELENLEHEDAEEIRVLYVALTRAREGLVLLSRDDAHRGSSVKALEAWGYDVKGTNEDGELMADGRVVHRHVEPPPRRRLGPVEPPAETTAALDRYERAVQRLRSRARPVLRTPSGPDDEREAGTADRARRSRDVGLAVGQAVHRALQVWDGTTSEALREALAGAVVVAARDHAVDPTPLRREATCIVETFLASELAERFRGCEQLGRELPMLRGDDQATWRGSIDLLYRDRDGTLVVADYKTDETQDTEQLTRRYRPQLAAYVIAVRDALGLAEPPRAELWLLRTGRRIGVRL